MSLRMKLLVASTILLALLFNCGSYLGHIATAVLGMPSLPPMLITARAKLALGSDRQEAMAVFSDAWFHADCTWASGDGDDLFFYGQKSRNNALILVVRSEKSKVTFIGMEENYRLEIYKHCIPADVFEPE